MLFTGTRVSPSAAATRDPAFAVTSCASYARFGRCTVGKWSCLIAPGSIADTS